MAVSYGSSGVRSNKAAVAITDTVTPALPVGVAAGDLLVIFASSFRDATTFVADQGYVNTRQNTKIAILEKTAGALEIAPTVVFGGLTIGDLISAVIIRFPGGAATKDWSNVTGAASATTLPGPPLTVTDTGSVGVVIGYQPNDKTGATFTANSWTEREYTTTTTGTDGTHYVATQDGLASGSQTMPTWTWVGGLEYRAISFSVPPGTGDQTITGALFSNSNTFFGATVSRGAVSIAGSLYSDADAFYGATVTAIWPISGSLYQDTDAFYAATVSPGSVSIVGTLYSDPDAFYGANVANGGVGADRGDGAHSYDPERRKKRRLSSQNRNTNYLDAVAKAAHPPTEHTPPDHAEKQSVPPKSAASFTVVEHAEPLSRIDRTIQLPAPPTEFAKRSMERDALLALIATQEDDDEIEVLLLLSVA